MISDFEAIAEVIHQRAKELHNSDNKHYAAVRLLELEIIALRVSDLLDYDQAVQFHNACGVRHVDG